MGSDEHPWRLQKWLWRQDVILTTAMIVGIAAAVVLIGLILIGRL